MSTPPRRVELSYEVPFSLPGWVVEDDAKVPEPTTQDYCLTELMSRMRCRFARTGRDAQLHRNRAVRWNQSQPAVGVDPDLCVLEPSPQTDDRTPRSICTWKPGFAPPVLAVEVVSDTTAEKDYLEGPQKYAASGTRELWVFDPQRLGPTKQGGPWVLQVWERARNGRFRRTFAGDGPAWSEVMQCWLLPAADDIHLLLCDDEEGEHPWPTEAEYGARQKRRAQRHKQRAEQEKQRAEQERAEKESALARIAELEAALARAKR